MNLSQLILGAVRWLGRPRPVSSSIAARAKSGSPFAAPESTPRPAEVRLALSAGGLTATAGPHNARRPKRSWFGWLRGSNRRRETIGSLVQGELLLTQVRPLRNDFLEEDATAESSRAPAKLLYETPPSPVRRDDQDHAWNRLRNRRVATHLMKGE